MKVHVEAKPLHEPLAGGTPGATVSVEPMVAGQVTWSRWMMESPGGRLLTLKLMRALITGEPAMSVPCPSFLIRHPSAGAILVDTGLHPSIATDGQGELRRARRPRRQAEPRAGRRRPGAAAQARARAGRGADRGDDPHAHRPHLGDLRVPARDLRRQRGRVGGGDQRPQPPAQRLPPAPLRLRLRLPHGRLRPRRRRLLRELRPHPRPLRRRLDPPRLHPGPQRRAHVDRLPPRRSATS